MNQKFKTMLLWGVLIFLFLLVVMVVSNSDPGRSEVDFSEFQTDLNNGKVKEVNIRGRKYLYTRTTETGLEEKLQTVGVEPDREINKDLLDRNVKLKYQEDDDDSLLHGFLISWLPMILLIGIW